MFSLKSIVPNTFESNKGRSSLKIYPFLGFTNRELFIIYFLGLPPKSAARPNNTRQDVALRSMVYAINTKLVIRFIKMGRFALLTAESRSANIGKSLVPLCACIG